MESPVLAGARGKDQGSARGAEFRCFSPAYLGLLPPTWEVANARGYESVVNCVNCLDNTRLTEDKMFEDFWLKGGLGAREETMLEASLLQSSLTSAF